MFETILILLVAAVLCWLAGAYLPKPFNWVAVLLVLVLTLARLGWISL